MARDFNGTTDRIDWGNVFDTAGLAWTVAMWIFPNNETDNQYLFVTHNSGDTATGSILIWSFTPNGKVEVQERRATTNKQRHTSLATGLSTGAWEHWVFTNAVGTAATNIRIYRNGSEATYEAPSDGVGDETTGPGSWTIGGRIQDDNRNFDARFAEVALWGRVIDTGERLALANNYSPAFFPRGLRWYPDLIRHQRDRVGGQVGTLDGTSVIAHPRMIYPAPTRTIHVPAAAAVGNPWHVYAQQ